jgi:hypothetical protein
MCERAQSEKRNSGAKSLKTTAPFDVGKGLQSGVEKLVVIPQNPDSRRIPGHWRFEIKP